MDTAFSLGQMERIAEGSKVPNSATTNGNHHRNPQGRSVKGKH
jgi:hypothetical protein